MSDLLEVFGYVVRGGFGIRFLFSKNYRDIAVARWSKQSKFLTFFEILESVIGIAIIAFVIAVIWSFIG